MLAPAPARADTLPDGFVYLRDVAPSVLQEIRYTTAYNFVGAPIDGYEAPECILTARAARALAAVQAEVERDGLSLKVYDCYRPQAAVNHFARWARDDDEVMKAAFYPDEPKGSLFARGYIASRSGHSRGSTVDLTLVPLPHTPNTAYPDPADGRLPRCDRPLPGRFDEGDLDMGTAYDCLSTVAATESGAVSAEVRRNRYRLREVMSRHGFRNYAKEWWHFTLRDEPYRSTYFDFPVR
jgi:D-alanyl-D-alanine dipeptidase